MLGDSSSSVLATTTTAAAGGAGAGGRSSGSGEAPPPPPHHHLNQLATGGGVGETNTTSEVGRVGSNNSGEEYKRGGGSGGDDGDRSFGGNRWPRQETLALLKIRSDMDVAFRDASVKGPLWEEVSRKLAELDYNRSAKKCKEKFENVFKYHKRTKESRTGKQEGKTYRFFDQLEAFDNHSLSFSSPQPPYKPPAPAATTIAMPIANPAPTPTTTVPSASIITATAPATTTLATHVTQHHHVQQGGIVTTGINLAIPPVQTTNPTVLPSAQATNPIPSFSPDLFSNSTSSSTSSDVELQGRRKRKRKWKDFFERLMKEVIHKQEDMQKKFLEAIEKREHDRIVKEESWRMQEMARINREREILAQERSIAAAKDAAVMTFLQKLSEQQQQNPGQVLNIPPQVQPPTPQSQPQPQPQSQPPLQTVVATPPPPAPAPGPQPLPITPVAVPAPPLAQAAVTSTDTKSDNGDQTYSQAGSSRWPKVEVQALINLRTTLDSKYQENGPKGPLWEDISAGMRKLGYNRSSKRCKEKWENINKYFKKVKESNKKRPEDSKTCPYFHQLNALYKEKNKSGDVAVGSSSNIQFKPGNSVPLMVRPEQQWPPAPPSQHGGSDSVMEDLESDDHQNDDDKDNDDNEEDEAGGYEIVPNRPASMSSTG